MLALLIENPDKITVGRQRRPNRDRGARDQYPSGRVNADEAIRQECHVIGIRQPVGMTPSLTNNSNGGVDSWRQIGRHHEQVRVTNRRINEIVKPRERRQSETINNGNLFRGRCGSILVCIEALSRRRFGRNGVVNLGQQPWADALPGLMKFLQRTRTVRMSRGIRDVTLGRCRHIRTTAMGKPDASPSWLFKKTEKRPL